MISKFHPVDIIALTAIIGGFILIALGKDGTVSGVIIAVAAYYFGKSTTDYFYHHKNGGEQ